jgi:hypothetical protein
MIRRLRSIALLAAAVLVGCDRADAPRIAPVKGKVTLDGVPLATGEIKFGDGAGEVPLILAIKDGAFQGTALVGAQRVEIYSYTEPVGGSKGGGFDVSRQNVIPNQYNAASTLTSEVSETGPNEFNFDLRSQGK